MIGVRKNCEFVEFLGKVFVVVIGVMEKMIFFENNDLLGIYGVGVI